MRVLEQVADARGTVAILWHVDRFDRVYGRGWDRAYERLLQWVVDRGRAAGHAAAGSRLRGFGEAHAAAQTSV